MKTLFLSLWLVAALPLSTMAQVGLNWITNSSVKLEQVIGDVDWATGSNVFINPPGISMAGDTGELLSREDVGDPACDGSTVRRFVRPGQKVLTQPTLRNCCNC